MNHARLALWSVTLVCALALSVYVLNGSFTRYLADDYCIATDARGADLVGQALAWYDNASGRLAQFVTLLLAFGAAEGAGGGGSWVVRLAPAALIVVTAASFILLAREGLTTFERERPSWLRASAAGLALLAAAMAATPQFVQSFFWLTGITTYPITIPFIALSGALAARAWRGQHGIGAALTAGALLGSAALYSEPAATLIVALSGLLLLAALIDNLRDHRRILFFAVCTAFALAALAIIVLAPGNSVRQATFSAAPSLLDTVLKSVSYASLYLVGGVAVFAPYASFLALAAGALIGGTRTTEVVERRRRRLLRGVAVIMLALLALVMTFMFPGLYATGEPPPARTFILIQWLIALALGLLGWAVGGRLRGWMPQGVVVLGVVACLSALWIVVAQARWTPQYTSYAVAWDAQDAQLRALDGDAQVTPLDFDLSTAGGLESLTDEKGFWVNTCAARYYGLNSVHVQASS